MEFIGYLCAIAVGISLGIFGSGGSILTVPIMVYFFSINPVDATGYSLFVVALTSAVGGGTYILKKLVNFRTVLLFGLPSILSVFITRKFIVPLIPEYIFSGSSISFSSDKFIMCLFALLMLIVSFNMIGNTIHSATSNNDEQDADYFRLLITGFLAGILTGFFGIGGGFIIIPALVLYAKIPLRMSVGTSLLIISFNSICGFTEEVMQKHSMINYTFLFVFSLCSIAGIFLGSSLTMKLNTIRLKKMFGWAMLILGICVMLKELSIY